MTSEFWADAEVISRYTRAQALADGVLVAVPPALATQAGVTWPVALTAAAWADAVAWSETSEVAKAAPTGQDETGRLWDLLTMLRRVLRRVTPGQTRAAVQVLRVPATGSELRPQVSTLHVVVGPGDAGEPVLTVMLPEED